MERTAYRPRVQGLTAAGFTSGVRAHRPDRPARVKLRPYRRMVGIRRAAPALFVCDDPFNEDYYLSAGGFPPLTATMERAIAGLLTGAATVWRSPSGDPVALHCQLRR